MSPEKRERRRVLSWRHGDFNRARSQPVDANAARAAALGRGFEDRWWLAAGWFVARWFHALAWIALALIRAFGELRSNLLFEILLRHDERCRDEPSLLADMKAIPALRPCRPRLGLFLNLPPQAPKGYP